MSSTSPTRPADREHPANPLHLDTLAYGGDWNPEQWDEETITRDIDLMGEAGVTLVSLGIFSWARLEPEEGRYDLDWLGDIIDRLHARGIAVDLATGTASPPSWMATDHPETLPVTADGVRLGFGSRQQYCPSSPVFRERSAALAGTLAKRFGEHPGVVLWHVSNEYGCHVHECFCDTCAAAFRTWLAGRHGDVEGLNAAWGTDFWSQRYSTFEQVTPPRAMPTFTNPAEALDWRRFCDHQLHECLRAEVAAIRAHSTRPVTTNFMGAFPPLDYRSWARDLDVVSDDHYPDPADPAAASEVAWNADLMRGLAGGRPWLLMEQAPSAVQWRPRNSPKRPGQFLLWSLERVAHGADGILQFQWRQSRQGAETFHSGMVPHAGRDSAVWGEVVETGRVLAGLTPVVGTRVVNDAAVVVDWEAEWARSSACGPTRAEAPFAAARAWHRTLWEAGHGVDVVGADADLSAYRLVVVPAVFMDVPGLGDSLSAAARAGAQVLVTAPTAVVDATMTAVLGGYLGSLRQLLGVRVVDHAALSGPVGAGFDGSGAGVVGSGAGAGPGTAAGPGTGTAGGGPAAQAARDRLAERLSRAVGVPSAQTWVGVSAVAPSLGRALEGLSTPAPDLRGGMWAEVLAPAEGLSWSPRDGVVVPPWGHGGAQGAGVAGLDVAGVDVAGAGVAGVDVADAGVADVDVAGAGAVGRGSAPASATGAGVALERAGSFADRTGSGGPEVLAVFDGRGGGRDIAGHPAITRHVVGAGGAWYVATDLDALSRAALLGVLAAHARLTPVLGGLPDGVEAARRGDVLFLLNHSDAAVELGGVLGRDLVSGTRCTGHVVLAPRSGMAVLG